MSNMLLGRVEKWLIGTDDDINKVHPDVVSFADNLTGKAMFEALRKGQKVCSSHIWRLSRSDGHLATFMEV